MITIYKRKQDIPDNMEYIALNDVFFDQNTASKLDEQAKTIIKQIDGAELISQYTIRSIFNGVTLDVDRLSSGCKTVLNVLYFSDKVFCLKECGDNALEVLYRMEQGNVYSEYAMIPLDMRSVVVKTEDDARIIENYEVLKEWWDDEC